MKNNVDKQYLKYLKYILNNGVKKVDRTGTGTISIFDYSMRFNMSEGFPLLTSKKVFTKAVIHELIWFLKGDTNIKYLKENGVSIWDEWANEEGELGPVYGWQWRMFGKKYISKKSRESRESREENNIAVDQIKYVITELLKENSRRAVLSAWNPVDLNIMALPPCHILYIFNKSKDGLCCHLTMRSSDLFLGLPFNIASTALLTQIIAHVLHLNSSEVCLSLCDAHIYEEHVEQVKKQVDLEIYESPRVIIEKAAPAIETSLDDKIKWIESLKYSDFTLINYKSYDKLPAIMK